MRWWPAGILSCALWASTPAWADCETVQSVAELRSALDASWQSLQDAGSVDEVSDSYRQAMVDAEQWVACLDGPLSPEDAAHFHRNRALASVLAGDSDGALAAASAALRLRPEAEIEWRAASDAFAELSDALTGRSPRAREEFPTSLAASVWSDGAPLAARTVGEPVIVQVFEGSAEGRNNRPIGGAWIDPRSPLPDWVVYPPVDCDGETVPVAALVQDVRRAEQAFDDLDLEGFESALERIAVGLPCVDQAIRPTQAAAIHRLEGLRQYTRGQRLGSVRSFQEAQTLDAAFDPPESLTREGSTLAGLWMRAGSAAPPPWLDLSMPDNVVLRVDGLVATSRPATLPFIVQAVAPSGEVLWTRYIPGGVSLPDLGFLVQEATRIEENRLPPALAEYRRYGAQQQRSRTARALQFGGATAIVGAGLLYGLNARQVGQYNDPTTPPDRIEPLRVAANRSATGSLALAVVGTLSIGASFAF